MRQHLTGTLWRLAIYAVVCGFFVVGVFAVFGQLRFGQKEKTYNAIFTTVSGLKSGNFVRIAGVEVGKVQDITINDDGTVRVAFGVRDTVALTEGSRVDIRYQDLIGNRYLALGEGPGGLRRLKPGDTIPIDRTAPALDLDALVGGFRPLFRALQPEQVNALTGQLISAFQGEGANINAFLDQAAALTGTLADRDQLIGQVVGNLNTVLGSLGGQSKQFAQAIDSLSALVDGLEARKQDVTNGLAYSNAAAGSIANLLAEARQPLKQVVAQTDRTAGLVVADHDFVDNLLATLPDAYKILGRLGLYGDYFSFYLCDLILKVNGKGGQPVYIKLAGQKSGRCAPR
ncbi:MCE family protein [Mycobacterium sp. E796]|uniref:MCE family protein n=1 Tax=Mycobacterium sp. E796 TaxID=1834151 RepID=UPI0007FDF60C|nr:MCE family protein [Mycobacterium sp. E796]OBI70528.1 mammalian cell entry protein [Mycobacterium sp. E796]